MESYLVGTLDEFERSRRKIVSCGGTEIGVFKLDDELVAWINSCAHMRGPVCQGRIYQRVLEPVGDDRTTAELAFSDTQRHIACPWHGYEFDLKTGQHPGSARHRLRRVTLEIRGNDVYAVL